MRIYLDKPTPDIKQIVNRCYPNYRGKKLSVQVGEYPPSMDSYWDSGYRNYFVLYDLATGKTVPMPSNHPVFEQANKGTTEYVVQTLAGCNGERILVVEHSYMDVNKALPFGQNRQL